MFDDVQIAIILQNFQSWYIYPAKGVLQGSILSPLLYAVFINTLPHCLNINMCFQCHKPIIIRSTFQSGATKASAQVLIYTRGKNGRIGRNYPNAGKVHISALLYADDVVLLGSP